MKSATIERHTYTIEQLLEVIQNLPAEEWPQPSEILKIASGAVASQRQTIFKKVLGVYALKTGLPQKEQEAVWRLWSNYSPDKDDPVKERYILQRLNNVMQVPEELKGKLRRDGEFQAFSREFFSEKSSAWKHIPAKNLEAWLADSKKEFENKATKLTEVR